MTPEIRHGEETMSMDRPRPITNAEAAAALDKAAAQVRLNLPKYTKR